MTLHGIKYGLSPGGLKFRRQTKQEGEWHESDGL